MEMRVRKIHERSVQDSPSLEIAILTEVSGVKGEGWGEERERERERRVDIK